jgi:hypothetical protein
VYGGDVRLLKNTLLAAASHPKRKNKDALRVGHPVQFHFRSGDCNVDRGRYCTTKFTAVVATVAPAVPVTVTE